jgi:formate hydrogenlyase subunit 3/multisubunit Na+/H+ antiporter MnhD subunit
VSEIPVPPSPTGGDTSGLQGRTLLEIGGLITLVALAFAAIVGVIAVVDTDSSAGGFGTGFGIALLIFFTGATLACAFACLIRRRLERVALGALVAACVSIDMIVLGIWLDIDNEAYTKTAGIVTVWSVFALVVLALALAVRSPQRLALALYTGAVTAAVLSAVLSTWLIATSEDEGTTVGDGVSGIGVAAPIGNDSLLQVLGAMLVLLAAFWFGALAASRLPDQTLKRTLTTSPSSTT